MPVTGHYFEVEFTWHGKHIYQQIPVAEAKNPKEAMKAVLRDYSTAKIIAVREVQF